MALNNLEDRIECAIRHINTALDIDTWAQNIAVESMRMRIALMKGKQPDIIRCKDGKWFNDVGCAIRIVDDTGKPTENDFCSFAERRTNE